MTTIRFLLDTNILIYAEPITSTDVVGFTDQAVALAGLATSLAIPVHVHPASLDEIRRDGNEQRRDLREKVLPRYPVLESAPDAAPAEEILGLSKNDNDRVDNALISCLLRNAVSHLVSNDGGIHAKARKLRLVERVLDTTTAISYLKNLAGAVATPSRPVERVKAHSILPADPIFDALRADYPVFDSWWQKCCLQQRDCYILREHQGRQLDGLLVVKVEPPPGAPTNSRGVKICTFKIASHARGQKYGELLLTTAFQHARKERADSIWVTTYPKQQTLVSLLESYGFHADKMLTASGEHLLRKYFAPSAASNGLSALDYHIEHGPWAISPGDVPMYVIPIQPQWDDALFIDAPIPPTLFANSRPCAHAIKKAYLCKAPISQLESGALVLFYRTSPAQSIVALGVVEHTFRSTNPPEIVARVLDRTVYTQQEINAMCEDGSVLCVLFRHATRPRVPIEIGELVNNGVLAGYPQTITPVKPGKGYAWLRQQILERLAE